jgi:hypothetical protein
MINWEFDMDDLPDEIPVGNLQENDDKSLGEERSTGALDAENDDEVAPHHRWRWRSISPV